MILNVQLTVHLRVSSADFVNAKHPKVFGTEFYWALTWGQASPTFWPHWKKSCLEPHIKYIATCNHKNIS